ncbi:hypothetical protein DSECCO2_209250 [anaerobic digester metagenome]
MDEEIKISNAIDAAKAAKEVLPQTTSAVDGALSTLVGWFNSFVLYPVKKANITYRYKLECFEDELKSRASQIPEDCKHIPSLMIAGPTLEALKYTYDEKELREMYLNLLASSMDSRKDNSLHPSYIEIIRQMNSFDATLFKFLALQKGYIKAINPCIGICETNIRYFNTTPDWFIAWTPEINIFQTSASLIRLSRLGLIELMYERTNGTDGYDELKSTPSLVNILHEMQVTYPDQKLELRATNSILYVNEYGKDFATVCLD